MKQIVISLSFVFVFLSFSYPAFSQEATESAVPISSTKSATVEYELAYPGILPDNPLYFLKTFRDRIVSMLISDPVKKTEFLLLNSDKRLRAGIMLIEKKKYEIGVTTISKSNNYMHETIMEFEELARKQKDSSHMREKIYTAILKHQEWVEHGDRIIDKNHKKALQTEKNRLESFEQTMVTYRK